MVVLTRREWLSRACQGFGSVALSTLFWEEAHGQNPGSADTSHRLHHPATARSVIFLYMDGGPSQVDTFDYKPDLAKYHGQDPRKAIGKLEPTQFASIGKVMQSPWKFSQQGKSGLWISDLFPHVAKQIDNLAVIRSMVSNFPEHTSANYFLHTGTGIQGRPSWGAWGGYGLGSGNKNLPTFVILDGGLIPPGGLDNFTNGFLPAQWQGSVFRPTNPPVANIKPLEHDPKKQELKKHLIQELDQLAEAKHPQIEAAISHYETAFRMQESLPALMNLSQETVQTKKAYGLESTYKPTVTFGTQCLIARRMVEKGVRFIELTCPSVGTDRWDQHNDIKGGHEKNALAVDQPIAALLADLKQRGLLESTLLVWGGEFGRTPFAQGGNGRDHNPHGFSMWLAGGGIQGGQAYGETDQWGYKVVNDRVEVHDLHATMLHLLGIDHTKLTFRFSGRDIRLTDVHGKVLTKIIKKSR